MCNSLAFRVFILEMREAKFDIEQALRRRLNWGKGGETSGLNLSENSIIDEVGNRFTSLKKKISYRDRVIAESRETISNQKARFDAETFLYRGNASLEIISDKQFLKGGFDNRNVVIYGNADNNRAWKTLLADAPIQVSRTQITIGNKTYKGDDLTTYFTVPRKGTKENLVGVIAGTGIRGARATYPNDYISGISGYPDAMIFGLDILKSSISGVKAAGFFGNDWTVENGNFKYSNQ